MKKYIISIILTTILASCSTHVNYAKITQGDQLYIKPTSIIIWNINEPAQFYQLRPIFKTRLKRDLTSIFVDSGFKVIAPKIVKKQLISENEKLSDEYKWIFGDSQYKKTSTDYSVDIENAESILNVHILDYRKGLSIDDDWVVCDFEIINIISKNITAHFRIEGFYESIISKINSNILKR